MPYVTLKFSLKIKHSVRQSLFFSLLFFASSLLMFQAHSEILPDIEAHQFKVTPLEKSHTGRVYRFKVDPEQLPRTGSILLIEANGKPTMAFRVLKTENDLNEFIAKRVRRYDTTSELKLNERYDTAEKISDLVTPPPAEAGTYDPNAKPLLDPVPGKDLIASGTPNTAPPPQLNPDSSATTPLDAAPAKNSMNVEQYDDALDTGTSPDSSNPATLEKPADASMDMDDDEDIVVKEKSIINPYRFAVGISIGSYKNLSNLAFSNPSSGGFSAYFSQVAKRGWLLRKDVPQDSLNIEYGFSYYVKTNVTTAKDEYDFLPLRIDLRYDIHLSEYFSPFLYAGAQYNLIFSTANFDTTDANAVAAHNNLMGFQPDFGVGMFYTIGPQWYLRADLGMDRLAIGLTVKW